jgi:hypothetical protein
MGVSIKSLPVQSLPVFALLALFGTIDLTKSTTFDWSFGGEAGFTGSGTRTSPGSGAYQVTSITGVTSFGTISGLDVYDFANNLLFYPALFQFDTFGIGFNVNGGLNAYVIYQDAGAVGAEFACGANFCVQGPGTLGDSTLQPNAPTYAVDFFNAVPSAAGVPAPIVGAGLPGLVTTLGGFFAWRRRRNQAAAA